MSKRKVSKSKSVRRSRHEVNARTSDTEDDPGELPAGISSAIDVVCKEYFYLEDGKTPTLSRDLLLDAVKAYFFFLRSGDKKPTRYRELHDLNALIHALIEVRRSLKSVPPTVSVHLAALFHLRGGSWSTTRQRTLSMLNELIFCSHTAWHHLNDRPATTNRDQALRDWLIVEAAKIFTSHTAQPEFSKDKLYRFLEAVLKAVRDRPPKDIAKALERAKKSVPKTGEMS